MVDSTQKFDIPEGRGHDTFIWEETLEERPCKVDIWKGCPDFPPPQAVIKALIDVATNGDPMMHQYTKGCGHPRFTSVLSKLYSTLTKHCDNEVVVTVGVYGAVYNTILGNIANGDEVIIIEPFSDFYDSAVRSAGGVSVFVPLRLEADLDDTLTSSQWVINPEELKNAFNSKTKMIIIDTPNAHLGKVYSKDELSVISNLCTKWNVMCVAIEADEFLILESEKEYTRFGTLPDMHQRTVTIGATDNTFFLKGWKVAWAYGPSQIIKNTKISHLNSVYVCTTVLQEALAIVMEEEVQLLNKSNSLIKNIVTDLNGKKQHMIDTLLSVGVKPILPDSGIFLVADWSLLETKIKSNLGMELPNNFDFVKWFVQSSGIQGVPLGMFFSDSHASIGKKMIRFCFNKKQETLLKARELFEEFASKL